MDPSHSNSVLILSTEEKLNSRKYKLNNVTLNSHQNSKVDY